VESGESNSAEEGRAPAGGSAGSAASAGSEGAGEAGGAAGAEGQQGGDGSCGLRAPIRALSPQSLNTEKAFCPVYVINGE